MSGQLENTAAALEQIIADLERMGMPVAAAHVGTALGLIRKVLGRDHAQPSLKIVSSDD